MARLDLHHLGEERSIAMHRAVAERFATHPKVLQDARDRVRSWLETGSVHRTYAEAWDAILAEAPETIAALLIDPSERSRALRQVSPFAGALDARTRWKIWKDLARALG